MQDVSGDLERTVDEQGEEMPLNPNDVADYVICRLGDKGETVSNLKLQKLLYYAQAWHLAIYDEPLFSGRLEAWVHGAVQPAVYHRFKSFRWDPISAPENCPSFDDESVTEHLDKIIDAYGKFSARQLERLVHQEEPWRKARGDLDEHEPSTAVISHEDMKEYYRRIGRRS